MPSKFFLTDDMLIFFLFFPKIMLLHFMQTVHLGDNSNKTLQPIIIKLFTDEFGLRNGTIQIITKSNPHK